MPLGSIHAGVQWCSDHTVAAVHYEYVPIFIARRRKPMGKVMLSILLSSISSGSTGDSTQAGEQPKASIRPAILAAVEKELDSLSRRAKDEAGPDWPRPSDEVAFMLLTGLAARGSQAKQTSAEDLRQLGMTTSNRDTVQLFTLADDARVTIVSTWMQDKSGSYARKVARLHRLQGGKWIEHGSGTSVASSK
jgi:hypothetical protein